MDSPLEAQAPPAAQPVKAPRQLPSLPIEILQRIIQLALPRLSFKTFRERYDILLTCCRVNKLWAAMAKEELYHHVGLEDEDSADIYLAQRTGLVGVPAIQSFRLLTVEVGYEEPDWPPRTGVNASQVEALLRMSPNLHGLQLVGRADSSVVNSSALSAVAEGLEHLTIALCGFIASPRASIATLNGAKLRRLALFLLTDAQDAARLLASAELPHLEALAIVNGFRALGPEGGVALEQALLRFSAQLRSFTLSFGPYDNAPRQTLEHSTTLWSSFCVLDNLTLDINSPVHTILPLLSAPLVRLRLCPAYDVVHKSDLHNLVEVLLASPPCLQMVKQIVVPNYLAALEGDVDLTRRAVAELCAARGIELVERLAFPAMDWMAALEDHLDAW